MPEEKKRSPLKMLKLNKNMLRSAPILKNKIAESRDHLYRVALAWCGDEMLADDLAQETIATGIAKRQQLRDETRLFAWLYSILNSKWCHYLRKKKAHEDLDNQMVSEELGPQDSCEEQEIVNRVRRAVASLPMKERQVIALVDLGEFKYCDVAEVLDIPIGTVMSRLHRARKGLLDRLDKPSNITMINTGKIHIVE